MVRVMKHMLMAGVLCLLSANLPAQEVWSKFSKAVTDNCLTFSYTYRAKSSITVNGEGTATVQGSYYKVSVSGIDVYCDGKTQWTIDTEAKEAIIENMENGSVSNPALLVCNLDTESKIISDIKVPENGQQLEKVVMQPLSDVMGVTTMTVWYRNYSSSKPVIAKASAKLKDGTAVDFTIRDMKFSEKIPATNFKFNEKLLDGSWVVTDLR